MRLPLSMTLSLWTQEMLRLRSCEHETLFSVLIETTGAPSTPETDGAEPMAENRSRLRAILERIRDDAQQALTLLEDSDRQRSLRWQCAKCGHVKHFTRPVPAEVAQPCPKCGGGSFVN